jgi:hypothetical protein
MWCFGAQLCPGGAFFLQKVDSVRGFQILFSFFWKGTIRLMKQSQSLTSLFAVRGAGSKLASTCRVICRPKADNDFGRIWGKI